MIDERYECEDCIGLMMAGIPGRCIDCQVNAWELRNDGEDDGPDPADLDIADVLLRVESATCDERDAAAIRLELDMLRGENRRLEHEGDVLCSALIAAENRCENTERERLDLLAALEDLGYQYARFAPKTRAGARAAKIARVVDGVALVSQVVRPVPFLRGLLGGWRS